MRATAALEQSRSPSLHLDSLYGLGPDLSPEFYKPDKVHLKTGTTTKVPDLPVTNKAHPGFDLTAVSQVPSDAHLHTVLAASWHLIS